MTGKNVQYIEHRGVNATPDNDREIYMEGDEAVYKEYAYGQAHQAIVATPEYAKATPQHVEVANEKKLNYKSPTIVLQRMLEGDWFDDRSTNKELYNKEWRTKLVSDLMASEHGAYIATLWEHDDKRLTIKGRLIGILVGAGVLKTNNAAIARASLGISNNTRDEDEKREVNTFGKYIGEWKKEPYADWVRDYVDKTSRKK